VIRACNETKMIDAERFGLVERRGSEKALHECVLRMFETMG
jgi:hypothetical protein